MLFNHPAKFAALGKPWALFSPYPMIGRGSWISRCPQLAPHTKLAPIISMGASLLAWPELLAVQTTGKRLRHIAVLCLSHWRENENSNLELILQMGIFFQFPELGNNAPPPPPPITRLFFHLNRVVEEDARFCPLCRLSGYRLESQPPGS